MSAHFIEESQQPRVIISATDAEKLRAKVVGMRRAALAIQENARRYVNEADDFLKILDLLKTETDEPL